MISGRLIQQVLSNVRSHCEAKGYTEGPGINNFVPHDCVAAFAMAQALIDSGDFDHYVAVAPEGHIYGYFFEALGVRVLSGSVDYPPTKLEPVDDLSVIKGSRVLIIEDDVSSGKTLGLVVAHLDQNNPCRLSLYLGHSKSIQKLDNVPNRIMTIYLSEDCLDLSKREICEHKFASWVDEYLMEGKRDS